MSTANGPMLHIVASFYGQILVGAIAAPPITSTNQYLLFKGGNNYQQAIIKVNCLVLGIEVIWICDFEPLII